MKHDVDFESLRIWQNAALYAYGLVRLDYFGCFEKVCRTCETLHERIPPKTPNMNTYIESFHRVLEYECLKRYMFQIYAEAYQEVATYIEFYHNRRIHSSILDLSPSEFYRRMQIEELKSKEVRV